MKTISSIFVFAISILLTSQLYAQEAVPKEILLNTLNNVNYLKKVPNETVLKLMDYNKGFVDKVYDILDSNSSKKAKKDAFKKLSDENEKNLIKLFGKKKMYKDYVKLMEVELEPLVKKNKDLKYLY